MPPPREAIPVAQKFNSGGVVISPGTRATAVIPTATLPAPRPSPPGPRPRRRWGPRDWCYASIAAFFTLLDVGLLALYTTVAIHYLHTRHG